MSSFLGFRFPYDQALAAQPTSDGFPYLEIDEQTMSDLQWFLRSYHGRLELGLRWYGGDGTTYPTLKDTSHTLVWEWDFVGVPVADAVAAKVAAANGVAFGSYNALLFLAPDLLRSASVTPHDAFDDTANGTHQVQGFDVTFSNVIIGNAQLFQSATAGKLSIPLIGSITVEADVALDGVNPSQFTETTQAVLSTDEGSYQKALGTVTLEGVSVPAFRATADNVGTLGGLTITGASLEIDVTAWNT